MEPVKFDRTCFAASRISEGSDGSAPLKDSGRGETKERNIMETELIELTQKLLDAITTGDWATYQELCDPSLTAFEPESRGQLVAGLPFHKFYFDLGGFGGRRQTTLIAPNVRIMGDVAIVAYVHLTQRTNPDGTPATQAFEETRVWQKRNGRWRHVHFHRSKPGDGL